MVEVLDDFDIIFHRKNGDNAGRLKLSYSPPKIADIVNSLETTGFTPIENRTWFFTKSLDELVEFYSIPGFGTKAYRDLEDIDLKKKILDEIVQRLSAQKITAINFRWAEFCAQKTG